VGLRSTYRDLFATGSVSARLLIAAFAALALVALAISGSWIRAIEAPFKARGDGADLWHLLLLGFQGDITGTRSLLVSGGKTVFAVLVAFAVIKILHTARGEMKFSFSGIELSGAQSGALVWCVVFVLVKLL
jgi:hypothetical protein